MRSEVAIKFFDGFFYWFVLERRHLCIADVVDEKSDFSYAVIFTYLLYFVVGVFYICIVKVNYSVSAFCDSKV